MPEMDGLAATKAIREKEKTTHAHVPIIALTAHAMKGDREGCLAAGMDAYVSKPIRAAELSAAIERLLSSNAHGAKGTSSSEGQPEAGFDMESALAGVDGDRDLLRQMAQWFLDRCPKLLAEVRDSILRGDGAAVERAAHKLKVQVGSFGAQSAYQTVVKLEELARAGDLFGMKEACSELEEAIERLQGELDEFAKSNPI